MEPAVSILVKVGQKNRPLVTFSHTWAFLFLDYAKLGALQETSRAGGEIFFHRT
jgi:hypothetical protein